MNHFWRLLNDLEIPHITLIDLDSGRFRAGWDRIGYALRELEYYKGSLGVGEPEISDVPRWDDVDSVTESWLGRALIELLERQGVYFSEPLDLDFSMISAFGGHYESKATLEQPGPDLIKAVLGKSGDSSATHYADTSQQLFGKSTIFFSSGAGPRVTSQLHHPDK